VTNGIGTLNEGRLHQALKALYVDESGEAEISVGDYVADVRGADNVLYEIQTGSFTPLKKKLATLLENHWTSEHNRYVREQIRSVHIPLTASTGRTGRR